MTDAAVSPGPDAEPLLEVEGLRIELTVRGRLPVPIARDVSFCVYSREIVGLIGESGTPFITTRAPPNRVPFRPSM